jgi:ADP-heptose:LPS heptosyltransferase
VNKIIYGLNHWGLGDIIASISCIYSIAKKNNEPVYMSYIYYCNQKRKRFNNEKVRIQEVLSILDYDKKLLIMTDERPPRNNLYVTQPYSSEFLKTKKQWVKNNSKIVCIHVGGTSFPEKKCTPEDKIKLIEFLQNKGYIVDDLDVPEPTLQEIVDKLCNCKFYIGVSNGITHLSHCTGTPIYLMKNLLQTTEMVHPKSYRKYTLIDNVAHFIDIFSKRENKNGN